MKSIAIVRDSINIEKLDEDLQAALTNNYIGLSTRFNEVIVFMADETPAADVLQAQNSVETHDPSQLTAKQVAYIAEQQALDDARNANPDNLDLSQFSSESANINALAEKLAWLELEIRDLRGG
jgi:hypothetical protein